MTNLQIENIQWYDIPNYNGYYQISEIGDVLSLQKKSDKFILKQWMDKDGYYKVVLYNNFTRKAFGIHRLVALTFIANTNNYPCVNHLDGNKQNNHYSNLEWCTDLQNKKHALETGLFNPVGQNNGNARLTDNEVIEARQLYSTGRYTMKEISNKFGKVSYSIWCGILIGNHWKHLPRSERNFDPLGPFRTLSTQQELEIIRKWESGKYMQKELMKGYNTTKKIIFRTIHQRSKKLKEQGILI